MKHFFIFLNKEILELWRSSKAVIVSTVFVCLSLMSVIVAKLMPEILRMAFESDDLLEQMGLPPGSEYQPVDPVAFDSWVQFFGNVGQLGLLTIVIMFGASLVREKRQGTAALLTARGLPRRVVVSGRLLSGIIMWSVAYWLAVGICYGCTLYYFPGETVENMGLAVTTTWFYGVMLLCVALWLSTLFKSSGGPVGITLAILLLLPIFDMWPQWAKLSPNWLYQRGGMGLMDGSFVPMDSLAPFLVTGGVCVVSVAGALVFFHYNEL